MDVLKESEFAKNLPKVGNLPGQLSPLEKAREKLLAEIDIQIALVKDPKYEVVTETKTRGGKVVKKSRRPKSWITIHGDTAYIGVRYSNKVMPLGGKRGSFLKCTVKEVPAKLKGLRDWAASDRSNLLIEKMIERARRPGRGKVVEGD